MFVRIVKMSFHEDKISNFLENFEVMDFSRSKSALIDRFIFPPLEICFLIDRTSRDRESPVHSGARSAVDRTIVVICARNVEEM